MAYPFIDGYGSVLTAESSIVNGTDQRQVVTIGSTLTTVPVVFSGNITIGSILSSNVPNQSVSGTVNVGNSSVQVISGVGVIGSVATLQGTSPWVMVGSISGGVSSVSQVGNWHIQPASVQVMAGTNVIGSVAVLQGTNPWIINSTGSVLATNYLQRNDAVVSALGVDLTYRPLAGDSAGRILSKPFAAEEARVEGYVSTTNTSVTTLVPAAGAGLRNYITDIWIANTGAAATLVTFSSGGGSSVLGYTIAPAGGGSNLPGLLTPIRTEANATFGIQAATATSTLYATVKGFKAP